MIVFLIEHFPEINCFKLTLRTEKWYPVDGCVMSLTFDITVSVKLVVSLLLISKIGKATSAFLLAFPIFLL